MIEYVGKCLFIETSGRKILVIGDLHIGFEEALNRGGVFVSRKMFEENEAYLEKVFEKIGKVDEVVLLGDVKHVFGEVIRQEWKEILGLLDYLKGMARKTMIVKGNHDKIVEPIAKKAGVEVKDYYILDEYCFLHGDRDFIENHNKKIKYWIVGHGHPAVKISDGVKTEKFKCFLTGKFDGKKIIIVPSFFDYSFGSDPRENDLGFVWPFNLKNFYVFVVQDESLDALNFGKLNKLK
jgi:uncharacterized protein